MKRVKFLCDKRCLPMFVIKWNRILKTIRERIRKEELMKNMIFVHLVKSGEVKIEVEQQSEQTQRITEKVRTSGHIGNYFQPWTTRGSQPTLKCVLQNKQVIRRCDLAIAKWFIDASISFNVANSTYFHPMIDALCSMIPRYKVSSMHCLRGDL